MNAKPVTSAAAHDARPEVTVDFADRFEPGMWFEYLAVRDRWFGLRRGIEAVGAPPDAFDAQSIVVLASDGQRCVGGARVTIFELEGEGPLPMEAMFPGLTLRALYDDLPYAAAPYAEISKLVVAGPDGALAHDNDIARRLFDFLWGPANPRPDVRHAFALLPAATGRLYRLLALAHRVPVAERPVPPDWVPPVHRHVGPFVVQAFDLLHGPATGRPEGPS
ncbi:MAG: hypothetical protein ABI780_12745 [Ardenticatenales bacterium]